MRKRGSCDQGMGEVEGDANALTTPALSGYLERRTSKRRKSTSQPVDTRPATSAKLSHSRLAIAVPLPTPSPTPMPTPRGALLICSLGNPGPTYANTLHSAGHTVLNRLAEHLGYTSFRKDRKLGNGLVSKPSFAEAERDWTLWQSTSYMNESGNCIRAAWMTWSRNVPGGGARLVVLHDELEKPLGAITLRTNQGASAKGHNGLKSMLSVMGNVPFARIGIGIGRPASRESDDVARYVLKKMTAEERAKIDGCVEDVVAKLKQVGAG